MRRISCFQLSCLQNVANMPVIRSSRASMPLWRRSPYLLICLAVNLLSSANARRALVEQLSASSSILGSGDCLASEVHLALGDAANELRVAWRTHESGCPSIVSYGRADVTGGKSAGSANLRVEGSSYTVSEDLMCDAPAKKKPFTVYMHTALMTDLDPNTDYWYALDDSSQTFHFTSPRRLGADQPFSFIAFGDMGESRVRGRKNPMAADTLDALVREVDRRPVDLILHVGDLAYADGRYKVWDSFMEAIQPLAAHIPYMVGIGNHEAGPCKAAKAANDPSGEQPFDPSWGNYGCESGGECGAMTAHRFLMPGAKDMGSRGGAFAAAAAGARGSRSAQEANDGDDDDRDENAMQQQKDAPLVAGAVAGDDVVGPAGGDLGSGKAKHNPPFWYSFEYGTIHFTMLSSEHDLSAGRKQARWLAADLAAVDRCRTPWLVVALHRPMYVVYPHKDNRIVGEHLRAAIEDLLLDHDVDLVLSGHVHSYYRSCSVAGNSCVRDGEVAGGRDKGITHMVIGTAGHVLSSVEDDQRDWCDEVINDFGFGRFDVDGDTLHFSFIRSKDGDVLDKLTLRSKVAPGDACAVGVRTGGGSAVGQGGGGAGKAVEGAPEEGSGDGCVSEEEKEKEEEEEEEEMEASDYDGEERNADYEGEELTSEDIEGKDFKSVDDEGRETEVAREEDGGFVLRAGGSERAGSEDDVEDIMAMSR